MLQSIVIVCTANICRSPMGQGLLGALQPAVEVSSAGLDAVDGLPPDPEAVAALRRRGIDISAHRSRRLTVAIVAEAELVLTTEWAQKLYIERRYPQARGRVLAMASVDIVDPYRRAQGDYARAIAQLAEASQVWAERISRLRRVEQRSPTDDAAVADRLQ